MKTNLHRYDVLEDLVQGSEEWLQTRLNHVPASEVAALFGILPYKTKLQLFEERAYSKFVPITESQERLFEIGHRAEPLGREHVEKNLGIKLPPLVVVSRECPDLMASLDGFNQERAITFEAKYMGADAVSDLKRGKLKPHHECQVQAQFKATGAERCVFFGLDPNGNAAIHDFYPDASYMSQIADAATQFMKDVREGAEPEPSDRDYVSPEDPSFGALLALKLSADEAKARFDAAREELLAKYKDVARIKAGGLMVYRSFVRGNVDYGKIPQLKGVDLERFRKEGRFQTTVKIDKKKGAL